MLQEVGYCPGIENYSRPLSGRKPGEPPYTLYDFFPDDFLLFVDESTSPCRRFVGCRGGSFPQDDARRAWIPAFPVRWTIAH